MKSDLQIVGLIRVREDLYGDILEVNNIQPAVFYRYEKIFVNRL